ncbi:GNAT family N-acetyltransferase [Planococcus shixiaomingii]|uniref:GNAT family N-acetyltransferase n=1 Tax=Planococcus shixiaomingii TaxID=3058393 RepID=UPI00261D734A|nr:GNAT family N-acetyltransferase [Planococcus sp. N022]WKA54667.1 GNAT family N-acetyltransferase [Planococcus sp. N022]
MHISEVRSAFQPEMMELLSFASSRAGEAYKTYINTTERKFYVCKIEQVIVGCIGIEFKSETSIEIKHIAVFPEHRGNQIGGKMIGFVCEKYRISYIFAETDQDAVVFYRKSGFGTKSLGEKYPGRERFLCHKSILKTS